MEGSLIVQNVSLRQWPLQRGQIEQEGVGKKDKGQHLSDQQKHM